MYLQGLLAALFYAAAALLAVAGAVKLRRPGPTSDALRGVGLAGRHAHARALGVAELVVGAGSFAWPGAFAPALALLYAAFAAFVAYVLLRKLPLSSCGCLGETDTEPSRVHVAVTATAAAAGALAALRAPPSAFDLVADAPVEGVLFLITVSTACYLTYVILVSLPEAFGAYRQPVRDPHE